MSLILNKLLPVVVLPLGLALGLLAAALWKPRRWLIATAFGLLWIASMPAVATLLISGLEDTHPPLRLDETPTADAIVCLSGSLRVGRTGDTLEYGDGFDRFARSVDLYRAGRAPRVVYTRGSIPWLAHRPPEGEVLRPLAIERGVPEEAIVLTDLAGNTRAEARGVAALAREHGWKRVILVTTAWHLPRAVDLFEEEGLEVVPFPCDWQVDRDAPLHPLDFVPDGAALGATQTALREHLGRLFYRIF